VYNFVNKVFNVAVRGVLSPISSIDQKSNKSDLYNKINRFR